jgi:hypothetical protein
LIVSFLTEELEEHAENGPQPTNCKQVLQPARTASKYLANYFQPEVTKCFDKNESKTLRSGKETSSESAAAKMWAEEEISLTNINKNLSLTHLKQRTLQNYTQQKVYSPLLYLNQYSKKHFHDLCQHHQEKNINLLYDL